MYYKPTTNVRGAAPQYDTKPLLSSIQGMVDTLGDVQTREQQKLLQQERLDAAANQGLLNREQQALLAKNRDGITKKKMEIDAEWREAEAKRAAVAAGLTADHRKATLGLQEDELKWNQNMSIGEGLGLSVIPDSTRPGEDKVENMPIGTPDMMSDAGPIPAPDKALVHKEYMEYLAKEDPDYHTQIGLWDKAKNLHASASKATSETIPDYLKPTLGRPLQFLKDTFTTTSRADEEEEKQSEMSKPELPKGLQSFEEFYSNKANPKLPEYSLLPQLTREVRTPTTERVPKKALLSDANSQVARIVQAYEDRTGKPMPKGMVTGLRSKALLNVTDTLKQREEVDKNTLDILYENLKQDNKHEKAKEIVLLRAKLDANKPLSTLDEVRIKKLKAEITKIQND